jgi:hypothetical protein
MEVAIVNTINMMKEKPMTPGNSELAAVKIGRNPKG